MTPMEKAVVGSVEVRTYWLICKQRLPYSRRQFDAKLRRVLSDALQYINQVSIGLNVQQPAGRQQTQNDANPLRSNLRKCCGEPDCRCSVVENPEPPQHNLSCL